VAIWLTNCVRVAALVLIGSMGAADVAAGGFHSEAGWLAFNFVALALCVGARRSSWLLRGPADPDVARASSVSNPTAPLLLPLLSILGASMTTQLATAGFEWLYPVRVIAAAAVLMYFARAYRALDWRITLAGVGFGVMAFAIWIGLERLLIGGPAAPMPLALAHSSQLNRSLWLACRILGAVVTVPIAEELAFRAFLLRRMVSRDFESVPWQTVSWLAVLLSSLAFGVLHGERWLAGTLAGAVYAAAVLRRGSIGDAVAAHATTNALIAGWVVVGGNWQLW
jgi:exosortase E/protease (VPEID-CTERM system)